MEISGNGKFLSSEFYVNEGKVSNVLKYWNIECFSQWFILRLNLNWLPKLFQACKYLESTKSKKLINYEARYQSVCYPPYWNSFSSFLHSTFGFILTISIIESKYRILIKSSIWFILLNKNKKWENIRCNMILRIHSFIFDISFFVLFFCF